MGVSNDKKGYCKLDCELDMACRISDTKFSDISNALLRQPTFTFTIVSATMKNTNRNSCFIFCSHNSFHVCFHFQMDIFKIDDSNSRAYPSLSLCPLNHYFSTHLLYFKALFLGRFVPCLAARSIRLWCSSSFLPT